MQNKSIFQSNMTSQQLFNQIADKIILQSQINANKNLHLKVKGCSMHPKPSNRCRKCNQIIEKISETNPNIIQQSISLTQQNFNSIPQMSQQFPNILKLNTQNPLKHLNQKLQSNILSTYQYKKQIQPIISVKQLLAQMPTDLVDFQAYLSGTTQNPTLFIMIFFKLIQLRPTKQQLIIMLKHNNVNIRGLGMLYVRLCITYQDVYAILKSTFSEKKQTKNQGAIGQYGIRLLDGERLDHNGIRLPRLPVKYQNAINQKIKLYLQTQQNQKLETQNKIKQMQIQSMKKIEEQRLKMQQIQQKRKEKFKERNRSRQNKKYPRKHSSSHSSSSSSSSNSSSSRSNSSSNSSYSKSSKSNSEPIKKRANYMSNKDFQRKTLEKKQQNISSIKDRIKQLQSNTQKRQDVINRYKSNNNQLSQQQQGQYSQSSSVENYHLG